VFGRTVDAARRAARWGALGVSSAVGVVAVGEGWTLLALAAGAGIAVSGRWVLGARRRAQTQLERRARHNARALEAVAREDRLAAPQMRRLIELQSGLLESLELLPEEYEPLFEEEILLVVQEVDRMAQLARRRSALRRYLEGLDREGLRRRIRDLERDLSELRDPALRRPFESALASRRGELAGYREALDAIGVINAQLESTEALVSSLRGEVLALEAQEPVVLESSLEHLRDRVALFRRSLREVSGATEHLPAGGSS
jgi:hypothetical protein